MNDFILLSGSSNSDLAKNISQLLKKTLGKIEITRFIDSECRVFIQEEVEGKTVFVIESLSQIADQHLVELCLIGQALEDLGAAKKVAVIPWLGYSKQDKAFRKGEAVSARLVASLIEASGFDQVITVELHSENVLPYFQIPLNELSTHELLSNALKQNYDIKSMVVASPDNGGQSRSERFAKAAGLSCIYLTKTRDLTTGDVKVTGLSDDPAGRDVIIFDDIINTGATAIKTSQFLKERGAKRIFFLATHAVLAGGASQSLEKSTIDLVIVTDTIFIPEEKQFSKLSVVSIAPLLSKTISVMVK